MATILTNLPTFLHFPHNTFMAKLLQGGNLDFLFEAVCTLCAPAEKIKNFSSPLEINLEIWNSQGRQRLVMQIRKAGETFCHLSSNGGLHTPLGFIGLLY